MVYCTLCARATAQCAFASDWVTVKVAWNLSADPAEVTALRRMLATCSVTTIPTVPAGATAGLPAIVGLDCPGEAVTIRNGGSAAADLSGWSIHDDGDKHTFAFPAGYRLAPGASATIRSGGPAGPGELQWLNAAVWNNDGDTATLVDAAGTSRSTLSC